jgi:hypothetical protein
MRRRTAGPESDWSAETKTSLPIPLNQEQKEGG